jgi:hypothetical protein
MQMLGMNRARSVDAKGNFEIPGVSPGSYFLRATVNAADKAYSARVPIEVGSANLENVMVIVGAGLTLSGQVRVEGDSANPMWDRAAASAFSCS